MEKIVIDGEHATMGRLASYCAKQSLLGKEIVIVNSNEIVIVGHKKEIIKKYQERVQRGGHGLKGQRVVRVPERIIKRTIRGMLSHKQQRGIDALKRIKCYNDTPKEYEEVKKIKAGKEKHGRFITLKELAERIK